jgi:hypothetical protein
MLVLTVAVLLVALGVASHRLAEYEWPWHRPSNPGMGIHPPREPISGGVLGASRTVLPRADIAKANEAGDGAAPGFGDSDAFRDEWPDCSAAIPDGCEDLPDEDVPLGPGSEPEEETNGVDLEAYLDKLDELALRVSFLVTGQLKNELMPALRDWLTQSGLSGDQNLNSVLAAVGPPELDEEEIAARNRYFLELYEQAINQPD